MTWSLPESYELENDLVQVLCKVTAPETSEFPRAGEMPVSSGDHAVGDLFVSIGHANEDLEWFVAGWEMTQDCWTDARCFEVVGWQQLPQADQNAKDWLEKIDLAEGAVGAGNGAFDAAAMAEDGITNAQLCTFLAKQLGPIAGPLSGYIKDGCGFGVIVEGDEVSIIGIATRIGQSS